MSEYPDLVQQMEYQDKHNKIDAAKNDIKTKFNALSNTEKLALCVRLKVDQISEMIEMFPNHSQREVIALLTHRFLTKWHNEKPGKNRA